MTRPHIESTTHVSSFLASRMRGKVAKWWLPDDVVIVDEIPHTATGKIMKTGLRDQFREYRLPEI
jgi:fatty-acyl-CoA synthase